LEAIVPQCKIPVISLFRDTSGLAHVISDRRSR
jgi:hypothetical protein